jgi:large subunit ribosomal protein L34e
LGAFILYKLHEFADSFINQPYFQSIMPAPRFKSRTYRRVHKRLPGGKTALHYSKRKPSVPKCAICKNPLKGMPRERPYKMQKLGISNKHVSRKFGGNLCSSCSKNIIIQEARKSLAAAGDTAQ